MFHMHKVRKACPIHSFPWRMTVSLPFETLKLSYTFHNLEQIKHFHFAFLLSFSSQQKQIEYPNNVSTMYMRKVKFYKNKNNLNLFWSEIYRYVSFPSLHTDSTPKNFICLSQYGLYYDNNLYNFIIAW